MNRLYQKILFSLIFLNCFSFTHSQDAPVTTCGTVNNAVPGTISIPITVTGFNTIAAISLTLEYDYAVLHFIQGTGNPALPGFAAGESDPGNGIHRVNIGWYGQTTDLADGSVLATLTFTYISGNSSLNWYDNGPSCEYADGQLNVLNDIPQEAFYINGQVCGVLETPGPISGPGILCQGEQGIVYSVDPVPNATGFNWSVPEGATIVVGQGTSLIVVDYAENALPGFVTVSGTNDCGTGPSSRLMVTVNTLPVADAGDDVTIPYGTSTTLNAAPGGSGNFTYHWSPEDLLVDPDVQNPQTVNLQGTATFYLIVTNDDSDCVNADEVVVNVVGGPLNTNPYALPGTACLGESVQLYANASGGSGDYSYLWTSNPPGWVSDLANPVITPAITMQYFVQVNDGFNLVNGMVTVTVSDVPTAFISGSDTLCGTGSYAYLPVDLTGTPPWSFIYSNGINSVYILDQNTTPYIIITSEPGIYTILLIENENCTGTAYGSALVEVFPLPPAPEITITGYELKSSAASGNQWYFNGELIPGANSQFYAVTVSGWYHAVVTLNGCSSIPSEAVDIIVGIEENDVPELIFYPNPARETIRIQCHFTGSMTMSKKVTVSICTIDGKKVMEGIFYKEDDITLDISNLEAGLYFVQCISGEMVSTGKLVRIR